VRRGPGIPPGCFGATRAVVIDEAAFGAGTANVALQMRSLPDRLEIASNILIRALGLSATLGIMG